MQQFQLTKDIVSSIKNSIDSQNVEYIKEHVVILHPADIVEVLHAVNMNEAKFIYQLLDDDKASDVLVELDDETREKFLDALSAEEIAEQIDKMDTDDAADIIAELSIDKQKTVFENIEDKEHAENISTLLSYEEDTAGALMAKELINVKSNWTVEQAMAEMRKQAEDVNYVYTVYVTNEKNQLVGVLSLKSLLYAKTDSLINELYMPNVKSVSVTDKNEMVAQKMKKYDLVAIPVVDGNDSLVGRITVDDVMDVIQDEAEKDYQMASGISEKIESSDNVLTISKARLPWLIIGLIGGILGAQVIGGFEEQMQTLPKMALFIPLIAAMGGNVGVQSSAIVVQSIANGTLGYTSLGAKLFKELMVALLNGVVCSLLIFGFSYLLEQDLKLSLTVGIALISVIIFAGIFGTLIPLLLNKYKIDPALATGPFITTMNDVVGLFIYFIIGIYIYHF